MYESPITMLIDDITKRFQIQQEDGIYKAVCSYGIAVDKDELIRALRYDREQYEEGFCDGYEARDKEIVRCKDCEHFTEGMAVGMCKRIPDRPIIPMMYDNFCRYGKRRFNDA